MRYKLNAEGYICAVSFGCYLDSCTEYTGAVPIGYNNLDEWASYACIQAYYIDPSGNLVLDTAKKIECENKQEQETIDNTPVLRKDLYGTDEVLDSQYVRRTKIGDVIVLEDIKTIAPRLKITGINALNYDKLSIYTQGKNMMPCNAVAKNICGVTFSKNASGSITVLGTATENIEYIIADGKATPIFALKENEDYYLSLGGLQCELRYYDGETTAQQYVGDSGLINLPQSIEVTQVVIKITSGDSVNTTFYPQLECGPEFTSYSPYKCKALELDVSKYQGEIVYPSDTLYAEDTLYPGIIYKEIDYIVVENGKITISVNDEIRILGIGSIGLFSDYSTIYSTKDVLLELEYSTNMIDVDSLAFLQGKSTTTNQFKILEDGSIEAHNGYFSGKIEADSGYFKGDITGGSININNRFKVNKFGDVTLPDNATISWGNVLDQPDILTDSQVTQITKNTVTTAYVNALGITAGSVYAENILGSTISGKTFFGGEIRSTNYVASSDAYTCGNGMRIDLTNGNIWWKNGSIQASHERAYMTALNVTYLALGMRIALSQNNASNLVIGSGFSDVVLSSGASVTSLAEKKENILPCTNALSAIQNTDVYYFNYKDDNVKRSDAQKVGFVIGAGYNLDSRLLNKSGDAIDIYSAIGLNWRATQQLYEKFKKQQDKIEEIMSLINL